MTNEEAERVIEFVNGNWAAKPLAPIAAAAWGSQLAAHGFDAVMRVLMRLIVEDEWRPSLAKILRPLTEQPAPPSASAAFENVWEQISKRPHHVNALEERAVARLGGWSVLGEWKIDERHWHAKRFAEAYDDLVAGDRSNNLRAIAGGKARAIGGGK